MMNGNSWLWKSLRHLRDMHVAVAVWHLFVNSSIFLETSNHLQALAQRVEIGRANRIQPRHGARPASSIPFCLVTSTGRR